jgi:hypothetical protein
MKIKTSIIIDEKLLEDFKIYCIKNKVTMTDKLDELIRKEITNIQKLKGGNS